MAYPFARSFHVYPISNIKEEDMKGDVSFIFCPKNHARDTRPPILLEMVHCRLVGIEEMDSLLSAAGKIEDESIRNQTRQNIISTRKDIEKNGTGVGLFTTGQTNVFVGWIRKIDKSVIVRKLLLGHVVKARVVGGFRTYWEAGGGECISGTIGIIDFTIRKEKIDALRLNEALNPSHESSVVNTTGKRKADENLIGQSEKKGK